MPSYAKISPNHLENLIELLGKEAVFTDPQILTLYGKDETEDLNYPPEVVVKPKEEDQISRILKWANQKLIPVTPRAGGTGLSGGALPVRGGVVLSLEKLNQILEIDSDNFMARVQPGVITQKFQEKVEEQGLFYPPDPASRGSCHLGGNLAECAGGPRAVKYGVTRDYVTGIRAVLPTGERIGYGGKLYKNVTGYNLAQLLIGSEGTLGIITEITVRLLALPRFKATLLAPFDRLEDAANAVCKVFQEKNNPSAIELMEQAAIQASVNYLNKSYPHMEAKAHLLLEIDAMEKEEIDHQLNKLSQLLMKSKAKDVLLADAEEKQQELWSLRRAIGEAIRSISVYKEEDTVVPRKNLPDLISGVKKISQKYGIRSITYGHAGDGNIHVNILKDEMEDEKWQKILKVAITEIFELTVSLGGTISGEHGIGLTQKPFLPIACSQEEIKLMQRIKQAFDPNNILNPGKLF